RARRRVRRAARGERLRRSVAVARAGHIGQDAAVVSERDEVPAVAAVSADDARARAGPARLARPRDAKGVRAGADVRPRAALLLPAAPAAHSPRGGRGVLVAVRLGTLDVRVADAGALSVHDAARLGLLAAVRLRDVGGPRRRAVSAVPLVCGGEATAPHVVAQLSLEFFVREAALWHVPDRPRVGRYEAHARQQAGDEI